MIYTGGRAFILSIPVTHTLYETNTKETHFWFQQILHMTLFFSTIENIQKYDYLWSITYK
jgi:hypothetical protein